MSLFKAPRDQLVCISLATFTKSAWVLAIFAATLSTYLPLERVTVCITHYILTGHLIDLT